MAESTPVAERPLAADDATTSWAEARKRLETPERDRTYWLSDVIVEGDAVKVIDETRVRRVADAYATMLHWPLIVQDGRVVGDGAPTAGASPFAVSELRPTTVFGLPGITGSDEDGAGREGSISPTRWRF